MPKAKSKTKLQKVEGSPEEIRREEALAVVDAFEQFCKTHDDDFKKKAINYAFLAGKSYEEIHTAISRSLMDDERRTMGNNGMVPFLSFDKISDVYSTYQGTCPEAIPRVGVVKRLDSPVNDSASNTMQNIIDMHTEHVWQLNLSMTTKLLPNLYPGAMCYVRVYPKYTGNGQVVVNKKGEIVYDAVVNDDGTIRMKGKTLPQSDTMTDPEKLADQSKDKIESKTDAAKIKKLGLSIQDVPEYIVDFEYIPVFDVALVGRNKNPRECIKLITMQPVTLSDLKAQFNGEDYKDQQKLIEDIAFNMGKCQAKAPQSKTDEYLERAGVCTEWDENLYGDDRMVFVWTEYHNPSSQYPKGRVRVVVGNNSKSPEMLWADDELPADLKTIPFVAPMLDGNPVTSAVKKSPMEAMIGSQVGRDRLLNSRLKVEIMNANPPDRWLEGTEFSIDGKEWKKIFEVQPEEMVYVRFSEEAKELIRKGVPYHFPYTPPQMSTVDNFILHLDEQFRNASHNRTMTVGPSPTKISGSSIENQYAIDKMDLTPQLQILQQAYFDMIKIACQMMKSVYHPGQRFRYSGGDDALEDAVWMQEHAGDELDLVLKSQIGQPLTKQAKLQEIDIKLGLMERAQQAGVDMAEILEATNMKEFAYSFHKQDPQYEFAKLRLLYITKGLRPQPVDDKSNIPLHVAVIQSEIDSQRFPKYDKDIQKALQDDIAKLSFIAKQKEAIKMLAAPPPPPMPGDGQSNPGQVPDNQ